MIRSMTAFANSEAEISGLTLICELRSVNHRYCDISFKIPERLRFAESELRAQISDQLKRGKIECSLSFKKLGQGQALVINPEAVEALLAATRQIEQRMQAALAFSALDVLAFPGVQQEQEVDKEALAQGLNQLVKHALAGHIAAREREGAQLKSLIDTRCQTMQTLVQQARLRLPDVLDAIRQKLNARIKELSAEPNFDRLEQELVYLAQKLDVAEELDRLEAHIREILSTLTKADAVGRRLDFLMQELNREANTLSSKSADFEMTQIAIELKVLIEQMREQVQNIE